MKKNLHPIDEIFLDGLTEKQDQPSLATWDAIEKSLDKNIVNTFKQKYIQLQRIIIVLLLLLAFVSIIPSILIKKTIQTIQLLILQPLLMKLQLV